MRWPVLFVSSVVLVAAACTGAESTSTTSVTPTPAPTTTRGLPADAAIDRIVVLDDDGNVVTMDRTGAARDVIAADGADDVAYFQPIWAPDGTRVAFTEIDGGAAVVVAGPDGSTRLATDTNAFYMYWSPTGESLSLLRNSPEGGLQMDVVDVAATELRTIGRGQPFYYSWSPEGDKLVTHIGLDRIEFLDPDGASVGLADDPGAYQAPVWTDRGIFHVTRGPANQQLVLSDAGGETELLATIAGTAIFGAPTSGTRLAVQVFAPDDGGVSAFRQNVPLLPVNRLNVLEVATLSIDAASDDVVVAFFWSPDGQALLMLTAGQAPRTLQWNVWRDGVTTEFAAFTPSPSFVRDFVPFFDQYAQSTTLWAPDGTAFVFPGEIDGESGIWVQPLDGGEPQRISDGTWAAWSPV